jgi:hypothetical protein
LYAFQAGKPQDRPGSYYGGRLLFYACCLMLVGIAQLILGVYIMSEISSTAGPLPFGPIAVAMFMVNFPGISIGCGGLNILTALYGMMRSCGIQTQSNNHGYQVMVFIAWFCTVGGQILVQVSYNPAGEAAAAAPSQTMLTLGIFAINAFLDYKMRTTPNEIPIDYYDVSSPSPSTLPLSPYYYDNPTTNSNSKMMMEDDDQPNSPVQQEQQQEQVPETPAY